MTKIVSGIKPTGELTIGNYLGAMQHWADYQDVGNEVYYFIADLHSLNTRQDATDLRDRSLDLVAWLLTVGIDPTQSNIFVQSQVPEHAQLAEILLNFTTMGELSRMTQYKDKAATSGSEGQLVGLYTYPVLMSADILLYDADEVPVGDDQTQHIELTRNIAARFNNRYSDVFTLPKAVKAEHGTRIMSLTDPTKKMSKSDSASGYILLSDDEQTIRAKIKTAVTDSDNEIRYTHEKPAVSNLMSIYAALANTTPQQIEAEYSNKQYGEFKSDLAELIVDKITTLYRKYSKIREDETSLIGAVKQGSARAQSVAGPKLEIIKQKLGLL